MTVHRSSHGACAVVSGAHYFGLTVPVGSALGSAGLTVPTALYTVIK